MTAGRLNFKPTLLRRILRERLWGESDFFLLDVGASGGIEAHWALFGERLHAIGFEPLLTEVERLQHSAAGTKTEYLAAFVTSRELDRLLPQTLSQDRIVSRNNDPFRRVSAVRAQELLRMDYVEHVFNTGAPVLYTDRRIVLDEFIPSSQYGSVDFLKVDTDGHDFEVLHGAEAILQSGGVLGVSVEAQFHGPVHDHANTFCNIDRWLRSRGFSLFDLEVHRYSRAALPAPFVYDKPAQTITGQVLWGDAVYFRDLADTDYEAMWSYDVTREQILKLACLFDLYGLPDCAAELLDTRRETVGDMWDRLLDELVVRRAPVRGYKRYMQAFERDPRMLYPDRCRLVAGVVQPSSFPTSPTPGVGSPQQVAATGEMAALPPLSQLGGTDTEMSAEVERLRAAVDRLKKKTTDLIERVKRRDEKIARLSQRVAEASERRSR